MKGCDSATVQQTYCTFSRETPYVMTDLHCYDLANIPVHYFMHRRQKTALTLTLNLEKYNLMFTPQTARGKGIPCHWDGIGLDRAGSYHRKCIGSRVS